MSTEAEKALPAPPPGKSMTIARKRLAGSAECLNCGTELKGPFCYYCGQPDKNLMRFFPVLLRELLEDTFDFDSRFARTIKPLLFKPGKLTRDYLDGRRFRYVPPMRLYIFSSIAFFFIAAVLASEGIQITGDSDNAAQVQLSEQDRQKVDEALQKLDPQAAAEVRKAIGDLSDPAPETETETETKEDDFTIQFGDEPWDRETNPLILPLAPDWVNDWINDEIALSPEKGRQIEENPDLIMDKVFEVLPVTMFVLLPVVALIFKFWYLFARKYYVEHLIFALHNHAFLFALLLILMLASAFAGWREPSDDGPWSAAVNVLIIAVWCWIPVYLMVSLKRVYQQGWLLTIGKFSVIGISYVILLALATTFVALLSFVLL